MASSIKPENFESKLISLEAEYRRLLCDCATPGDLFYATKLGLQNWLRSKNNPFPKNQTKDYLARLSNLK